MTIRNSVITTIILTCFFAVFSTGSAADVYQLANSDFESWSSSTLPKNWNTYETVEWASSLYKTAKNSEQCEQTTDVRPGSAGKYSAMGKVKKIWSIPANGMITTGCIYAGAASATDTKNHNYSKISDDSKSASFTGRPDSCVAWIKNQPKSSSQKGRFYILLHGNYETQDPGTTWSQVCAVAGMNPPQCDWTRYAVAFYYKGETLKLANYQGEQSLSPQCSDAKPSYALASFATNYVPGEGDEADKIYVDDVEMIYNSKLNSLTVDGTSVDNFSKNNFSYTVKKYYKDAKVAYVSDGKFATTSESYDEETGILTIKVMGDDYSANANSFHEYKIQFYRPASMTTFKIGDTEIDGFSSSIHEYTIADRAYKSVKSKISYTLKNAATDATESFDESTNTLTITFKNDAGDNIVYTFKFHAPFLSQLKSLEIAGEAVDGFSSSTYNYTVKNTYKESELNYEPDEDATAVTSYDPETYILTIEVRAKDYADDNSNTHTYKIQYHESYGSYLTALSINDVAVSDFSSTKFDYSVKDVYYDGITTITYKESAEAIVSTSFDASTLIYTITIKGGDYDMDQTNTHTYKITFHAPYGAQLTSLKHERLQVSDFDKDKYEYKIGKSYDEETISWEVDEEATFESSFNSETNVLTIIVKGGDFNTNSSNFNTYKIQFASKSLLTDLSINGTTLSNFKTNKYNYDQSELIYNAVEVTYTTTDGATAEEAYNSETAVLTITVKGADIETFPNNYNSYTIQFHLSYGSQLTSLKYNNELVADFAKDKYEYSIESSYDKDNVSWEADAEAKVKSDYNETSNVLTLTVSGGDIAQDETNYHTYTVQFLAPSLLSVLKVNNRSVEGFSSSKFAYTLSSVYDKSKTKITYTKQDESSTAEGAYDETSNTYTITVKGKDIAEHPSNFHEYILQFGKAAESLLTDLQIDGSSIDGFDSETYAYTNDDLLYSEVSKVSWTASEGATVEATYDVATYTMTITVKGSDIATNKTNQHIYTITFKDPTIYGSQLVSLSVNGTALADFKKDEYNYYIEGSYSENPITYAADALATVNESYDATENAKILVVNGGNIAKDPTNTHTYTIKFSSSFVYEANIVKVKVDGIAVEGFDSDVQRQTISADYTKSEISIEVSPEAQYCANYDKSTGILTVVVWAGNFDKNTSNFKTYYLVIKK